MWIFPQVLSQPIMVQLLGESVWKLWHYCRALHGGRCNRTLLSTYSCGHNLTNTVWMSLMQIQCLKIHVICYQLFTMGFWVLLYCWENTHQLYYTASQPADTCTPKVDSWGGTHGFVPPTYLQAPNKGAKLGGESFESPSIVSWGRFITAKIWSTLWGTLPLQWGQQE